MRKTLLAFILLVSSIKMIDAQTENSKQLPSVAIGVGVLTFNGDIGNGLGLSSFSRIKAGYNLKIEQRIGKYFGMAVNGIYGKLEDGERSKESNRNFQSKIIQADIFAQFHFDNDLILKQSSSFAPYIYVGFGLLKFDPRGDFKDKGGIAYNYWKDGSIRDLAETDANAASAKYLKRDYTYETQLKDSVTNYSHTAFAIPLGLAFNLKMNKNLSANIGATYYMAMTDWIDNVKIGKNDSYVFANVSLQYTFTKKEKIVNSKNYENVDFGSIEKADIDGDGVADTDDKCPGTPKGVKVDARGCAADADEDGVPDYKDKELTTKKGAYVDGDGVTQTDAMLAQKQAQFDSVATERSEVFNQNPSLAYLKDLDAKASETRKNNSTNTSTIPAALKAGDLNNDGYISSDEITAAIDGFFDGSSNFTVEKLNDLVDYFFEQ